jgi:pimeloyl-ACP methyl ester carboxylesterase
VLIAAGTRQFRRDDAAARARLDAVPRRVIDTNQGELEYADVGDGEPILAVHGIFGGCDAGLLSFGDLVPHRRVIAPSRFGYLGSAMPVGATPAMQADVFAELLDALGIDRLDIVAFSAGSTSSLQVALRHPDRIRHLVVMSGDWPGAFSKAPLPVEKFAYRSDLLMWLAKTLAGGTLFRLVAGIPKGFRFTESDRTQVRALIDSIFPVRDRSTGIIFDAYIGNPDVDIYPLEAITVPTLIVHSRDDTLASFRPAESAAARIPKRPVAGPRQWRAPPTRARRRDPRCRPSVPLAAHATDVTCLSPRGGRRRWRPGSRRRSVPRQSDPLPRP